MHVQNYLYYAYGLLQGFREITWTLTEFCPFRCYQNRAWGACPHRGVYECHSNLCGFCLYVAGNNNPGYPLVFHMCDPVWCRGVRMCAKGQHPSWDSVKVIAWASQCSELKSPTLEIYHWVLPAKGADLPGNSIWHWQFQFGLGRLRTLEEESLLEKSVSGGAAAGRLGQKGAEKKRGWQLRVRPETIDEFRVRKICCLDKELNRAKTMVAPTPGFTHKTTWGRSAVTEWRKPCV